MKIGEVVDERYRIIRLIGEGGMGVVYEVRHERIGQKFAMKCLHHEADIDEEQSARFTKEASAATLIGSEHIVFVTDHGETPDGALYIVMELLDGEDLQGLLKEEGRLAPNRAIELTLQICDALGAAHDRGIIHRDLKPANLFLVHREGVGEWIKVLDFGIAKFRTSATGRSMTMTKTGTTLGTPYYMAPEQFGNSGSVDHRADIYSVGVILYEMISGSLPFAAPSYEELLLQIVMEEAPGLGGLCPELDPALCDAVMRSITRYPEKRYQSMSELAEALRPFMESSEGTAPTEQSSPGALAPVALEAKTRPWSPDEPLQDEQIPASEAFDRRSFPPDLELEFDGEPPTWRGKSRWPLMGAVLLVIAICVGAFVALPHLDGDSSTPSASEESRRGGVAENSDREVPQVGSAALMRDATNLDAGDISPTHDPVRPQESIDTTATGRSERTSRPTKERGDDGQEAAITSNTIAEACRRDCDKGIAAQCTALANRYKAGLNIERDLDKAVEFYRRGCDGGHGIGCIKLGAMHRGKGDHGKAVELFDRACKQGFYGGCTDLGRMYEKGQGVTLDVGKAQEIYQRTCEKGYQVACTAAGRLKNRPAEEPAPPQEPAPAEEPTSPQEPAPADTSPVSNVTSPTVEEAPQKTPTE